jgi:hypothetical protein
MLATMSCFTWKLVHRHVVKSSTHASFDMHLYTLPSSIIGAQDLPGHCAPTAGAGQWAAAGAAQPHIQAAVKKQQEASVMLKEAAHADAPHKWAVVSSTHGYDSQELVWPTIMQAGQDPMPAAEWKSSHIDMHSITGTGIARLVDALHPR